MEYRAATPRDIPAVAVLFLDTFSSSVIHFLGQPLNNHNSINDIFSFLLKAEPRGFLVASDGPHIRGYLVACRDMRTVWLKAFYFGDFFVWAYRLLTGRYGMAVRTVKSIVRHKLLFLTSRHNYRSGSQAQILSISVHPDHQNKGIATNLLKEGLDYLGGVREIKLEVRPQNGCAIHLYRQLGFELVGDTYDSQGEWLVMTKRSNDASNDSV